MLFPNELWSMILDHNYHQFCVEVSYVLSWLDVRSYKNNLIIESIIGHLLRKINVKTTDESKFIPHHMHGGTPLMYACRCQSSVVQLLIENGAHVNAVSEGIYNTGWTAFMYACVYQPSVVQLLIDHGANLNAADENGRTALMNACVYRYQLSVVQLLIENGANVNATINDSFFYECGTTPLHFVCECQYNY